MRTHVKQRLRVTVVAVFKLSITTYSLPTVFDGKSVQKYNFCTKTLLDS